MNDTYKTVKGKKRVYYWVKGSRFIATLLSVSSQKEMDENLQSIKREIPGATHYVYASLYVQDKLPVLRMSDDGEPAGSSGSPLASLLEGSGLLNLMIIVVRFFGGTKLGLGGLSRAYTFAGREVLKEAEIQEIVIYYHLEVQVDYSYLGETLKTLERFSQIKEVSSRREDALIKVQVRGRDLETLMREVENASRGKAELSILETDEDD